MKVASTKTFTAGEALEEKRLVKLSAAGIVVYADEAATDDTIGVNDYAVANGEPCAVDLINGSGTNEFTAAGAIAAGDDIYQAADGKVQVLPVAPGTYQRVGKALEAASGDTAIFEGMFYRVGETTVVP